jgi:hypothetical protein
MNERIKELALQVDLMRYPSDGINIKIEKFAELIVRECMEQLNISNVPAPISAGLNLGRVAIKEHFGVEE